MFIYTWINTCIFICICTCIYTNRYKEVTTVPSKAVDELRSQVSREKRHATRDTRLETHA